jgi:hypothetical protein
MDDSRLVASYQASWTGASRQSSAFGQRIGEEGERLYDKPLPEGPAAYLDELFDEPTQHLTAIRVRIGPRSSHDSIGGLTCHVACPGPPWRKLRAQGARKKRGHGI